MTRGRFTLLLLFVLAVAAACGRVLGIKPPDVKPFPHTAHTDKGINCRECHGGVGASTREEASHIPGTAVCVRCHTKPHDARDCQNCHGLGYVRENVQADIANLKFNHRPHVEREHGQCIRCHRGILDNSDHVRPSMAVCLSCHEHQDDFATRSCDRCHENIRDEHVMPSSHVVHEGDWLREHGDRAASERDLCTTCHAERFCASCHGKTVPALPEKQAFDDPLRAGVHRAGFISRHPLEAKAQPGICTTCHTSDTCENCHTKNGVSPRSGAASPHPPGWLGLRGESNDHGRAAWQDPTECAGCHSGAGEKMCVGCHKVGGHGRQPAPARVDEQQEAALRRAVPACHGEGNEAEQSDGNVGVLRARRVNHVLVLFVARGGRSSGARVRSGLRVCR